MRKLDARQITREKNAFRYSSALERGDFSTVEIVLLEAEGDPLLAQMLAEINMVYENELIRLSPPHTGLNHSNNHHRKDLLMTTITLPTPQRSVQRWLPFTLAAACLSVLFIGALILRPNPNGISLVGLQAQLSATPTIQSTLVPTLTATPFIPTVSSDGTILPPTIVPPAGDFTPTPAAAVDVFEPTVVPPADESTPTPAANGSVVLPPIILQAACEGIVSSDTGAVLLYMTPTEQTGTSIGKISNQTPINIYERQVSANGSNNWYLISALDGMSQTGWVKGNEVLVNTPDCFTALIEAADMAVSIEQAHDLYLQEKFAEATTAYEQLITNHALTTDLLYGYGRVLIELDRSKDAIRNAQQIKAANPQAVESYVLETLAYLKQNDGAAALASAMAGMELHPTDSDLLAALALTYTRLGRYDEALKYGEAAVQSNDSNSDAHRAYAMALTGMGDREQAITEFEQAIRFSPQRFSLYADLALQFKLLNRMDDALAAYERLLALQPDNAEALVKICETYGQIGNNDNAESYCNRAVAVDPTYAAAYQALGGVHFRQRNYEAAINDFDQCLALGSVAIECYYQRGLASFYIGDCDTAWNALTAASAFNPEPHIYDIIVSGLKLITENCPKYKDLVITIPTPDTAPPVVAVIADAGATFTPTPVPAVNDIMSAGATFTATPMPMSGGNDVMALSTPEPIGVVPTVVPPAGLPQQAIEATPTPFPSAGVIVPTIDVTAPVVTSAIACASADVQIISPARKAVVAGKVEVTGIATSTSFGSYTLELIGLATGSNYVTVFTSNQPVSSAGRLGDLDLSTYPPQNYGLRLLVFDTNNQVQGACLVNFTLARTAEAQQTLDAATAVPRYTLPANATVVMETTALTSPFAGAAVSMNLSPGIAVTVDAQTERGDWLHVSLEGGKNGWVASNAVRVNTAGTSANPTDVLPSTSLMPNGFVSAETAALREEPQAEAKVIRILPKNTAFGFLQLSADSMWVLAALEDRTLGWVLRSEVVGFNPTEVKPTIQCSGTTGQQPAPLFSRPNFVGSAVPIGMLDANAFVIILDLDNQAGNPTAWYYVQGLSNPAVVGWVNGTALNITSYCSQFVTVENPATALTPTLVPAALQVATAACTVVNTSDESVPVYSGPSSDESESLLVNNLAPNTPAQLLFQQNTSDGKNWYLMLAMPDGGKQVSGWVNADAVQLVGEKCAAFR